MVYRGEVLGDAVLYRVVWEGVSKDVVENVELEDVVEISRQEKA